MNSGLMRVLFQFDSGTSPVEFQPSGSDPLRPISAEVGGLPPFRAFRQVVLPLSLPGLLAAGIFAFVLSWNEFLFALILTGRESRTMPVALASLMTSQGNQVGAICAATITMMVPIVLLTWFIQRYLVQGLTFGAVK